MEKYLLMNKNNNILEFSIKKELGDERCILENSYSDVRPIGFVDIHTWIENRDYAKHKQHLRKWIHEWGMDTLSGFINVTHCLGLNDTFWVKNINSELSWDNINLYDNDFTDVAQHTAFDKGLYGLQLSSTSPEFTAEGSFEKCWIKEGSLIKLYKKGASGAANVGLEPYAEYMASYIAKSIFYDDVVFYDLKSFKGHICSVCNLFTSKDVGYVPFYRLVDTNKTYTLNDILQICSKMGFEQDFRKMLVVDSIVFNQDRHMGNFGFLVNNDTQEIIKFAPLFDFNVSMLCNALDDDLKHYKTYEQEYLVGHKMGGTFTEVFKSVMTNDLLKELPEEIILPKHPKYNLSRDRMELLQSVMNEHYSSLIKELKFDYVKELNNEIILKK